MKELSSGLLSCIRRVEPYTPGEQPKEKVIKLNTNENPYPPSPAVIRAIRDFDGESMRLYPDPTMSALIRALADYHGVSPDMVFAGVGSDDVIAMCFLTFFSSGRKILFPDITYSFYKVWAGLFDIPYEEVPLAEGFRLDPASYDRENGGVIFPNPNAPTSLYAPLDVVRKVLDANRDVPVIVDEAYIDFAGESALSLLEEYDNLLVVRTFSKSRSMAGMRIGYAIGNPQLIGFLNDVKYSYNSYTLSNLAIQAAIASIEDEAYFREKLQKITKTRQTAMERLTSLGFECTDSSANFLFAKPAKADAAHLFNELKKAGIYVRHWDAPLIKDHLRITVGTDEEMEALYRFIEQYMEKYGTERENL